MLNRRCQLIAIVAVFALLNGAGTALPQAIWRAAWDRIPTITVVAIPGDGRLPLVRDAVAFWNSTFADLGSRFRLGSVTEVAGTLPGSELSALSDLTLRRVGPMPAPESVGKLPGNIIVALSDGDFVSF